METEPQQNVLSENPPQTPRRSTRKSVMPAQDYEQIVNQKRTLRSTAKENKDTILVEKDEAAEEEKVKWTPAKVGRVSEKRGKRGRKPKRRATFEANHTHVDKMNKTDLMELGLEVISDETEEHTLPKEEGQTVAEEITKPTEEEPVVQIILSDSLNCSDCIIVSPNPKEATMKIDQNNCTEEMESLMMSDDEVDNHPFSKVPSIVITNAEKVQESSEEQPKSDNISAAKENEMEIVTEVIASEPEYKKNTQSFSKVPEIIITNSENATLFHDEPSTTESISTTVKTGEEFIFADVTTEPDVQENIEQEEDDPQLCVTMPLVAMEPVEIVLRSIRKRSLSLSIGDANESHIKGRRNVTFHSPANQTTVIEDLDMIIAQSVKKKFVEKSIELIKNQNITQRRKRSFSFSDTSLLASKPIMRKGTPKKPERTPIKGASGSAAGATRTKLPNFAAIHEKHFNKMENLVEHVARKAERAKIFSSATKVYPLKKTTPYKELNHSLVRDEIDKSKAMKKIEWTTPKKGEQNSIAKRPNLAIIKTIPSNNTTTSSAKPVQLSKLPTRTNIKSNLVGIKSNTSNISDKMEPQKPIANVKSKLMDIKLNSTSILDKKEVPQKTAKAVFNLSTSLKQSTKPVALPSMTTVAKVQEEKYALRHQRHIDMFKGRTAATSTRKADNILRGVRSNRRFELQMQHRRNMEEK